ncbi:MAG: UvrD-helicase domain-containing protein [Fibrobacter sp.]|nr:UvrD-helicase domain-containing protein [Fibrobacter sp.]
MFSFIRNFFAKRHALAAEREQLCRGIIERIELAEKERKGLKENADVYTAWLESNKPLWQDIFVLSKKELKKCPSFKAMEASIDSYLRIYEETRCLPLAELAEICISSVFDMFNDSFRYCTHEDLAYWRKSNKEALDNLKKYTPDKFLQNPHYLKYKKVWEELFEVTASLKERKKIHNLLVYSNRKTEAPKVIGGVNGHPLDNQQIDAVIKEYPNQLILAGAGTGKTTTIVGKVKYLLKKGFYQPEDILLLSFTEKSARDMNEQIKANIDLPITASTFHALGNKILGSVDGKKAVFLDVSNFVMDQLRQKLNDKDYTDHLVKYLVFDPTKSKSRDDFDNPEDYKRFSKENPPKTLNGIAVKSYGELDIANFLFQNQVKFQYEEPYRLPTATAERRQYQPDFYLPDYDIYIEYFGINRKGRVSDKFKERDGKSASQAYMDSMIWKRQTHRLNNTKLVECFAYEKFEGNLLECLKNRLAKMGVEFKPMPSCELWALLQDQHDSSQVMKCITSLFSTMINHTKANNFTLEKLRSLNAQLSNVLERKNNNDIIDLFEPIFGAYLEMLASKNMIDFNDMINDAAKVIREGKFQNPYKFVIVDEYQDISKPRFNLLKALRASSDYKLFCVGDDWQSIYRFAGSDVNYILKFDQFWGKTDVGKIETTYRFPQRLIEASGSFVMKNPTQVKKSLKTMSQNQDYVLGVGLWNWRFNEMPKGSSVLFLGRYKDDIRVMTNFIKEIEIHDGGKITLRGREDLDIKFMTVHASKGLQADYVFILNNKNGRKGFPSNIGDASIMQLFLDTSEEFPYAEERRLYYVAMTRAKKKVFFVPPSKKSDYSSFYSEILEKYEKEMDAEYSGRKV